MQDEDNGTEVQPELLVYHVCTHDFSERREAQILHFKVLFRMLIKMKECPNMVIR